MKELTRAELKQVQLSILDVFVNECRARNLEFFLYYGSLIGAVRHNGIIPWDDDIDIVMPRAAYNEITKLQWQKFGCKLVHPKEGKTPYLVSKLCRTDTLLIENIDCGHEEIGVNIDIFPLDYIEPTKLSSSLYLNFLQGIKFILNFKVVRLSKGRGLFRNAMLALGKTIFSFLPAEKLAHYSDRLSSNLTRSLSMGSLLGPYGKREIMDASWFAQKQELLFEGRMLPIPAAYDGILKRIYGDYMRLPPKERQVSHHQFKAYSI